MSYDKKTNQGNFQLENHDTDLQYEVVSWVKEKDRDSRQIAGAPKEYQLKRVDRMTVKVWQTNAPADIRYDTLWGPFADWSQVEGFLAYDFGDEGSIEIVSSAK